MNTELKSVLVWDLPTRLFHWILLSLVILLWFSGEQGGNWMTLHLKCGYSVLTLVLFRILWGFWGSTYSRFIHFIYSIPQTLKYAYALLKFQPPPYIGHNPLGGWSVVFMLGLLLVQASTGLFANDDIFTEGPLANWVTNETSRILTTVHKTNFKILLTLISIHISAIFFYLIVKGENLILPMIHGRKLVSPEITLPPALFASPWRAGVLLCLVSCGTYLLLSSA